LKPKVIHIESNEPIQKWTSENHQMIMDVLYDFIFEFAKSGKKKVVVLKLIFKPKYHSKITSYEIINIDFTISEDEIVNTIDKLIFNFELTEEYEKCDKLLKLKSEIL
jgi:hypothetical protein